MSKSNQSPHDNEVPDLLKDLLITSLGTAGVKQSEIRRIVGCDMNRVSRIVKHIERGSARAKQKD